MGRRKRGFVEEMSELPWPVSLAVGVLGYLLLRFAAPLFLATSGGAIGKGLATQTQLFTLLGGGLLLLCCMAAISSYLNARRNRRLLDTRSNLDSLAALGWRDFERLVGEAFRRQGYEVEATGLGGADGGIDLILRKHGRRILVQCKHWRRQKVPVNVVREMVGLLAHHNADEIRIAAFGGFTPDAERFAQGKPIALIDGPALLRMVREVQAGGASVTPSDQPSPQHTTFHPVPEPAAAMDANACPRCAAPMVQRKNRRTGEVFLGCPRFPECRGTR
jgi:restriction system protein